MAFRAARRLTRSGRPPGSPGRSKIMSRNRILTSLCVIAAPLGILALSAGPASARVSGPAFYVEGQLYRTVGMPTDLSSTGAPDHTFDTIYVLQTRRTSPTRRPEWAGTTGAGGRHTTSRSPTTTRPWLPAPRSRRRPGLRGRGACRDRRWSRHRQRGRQRVRLHGRQAARQPALRARTGARLLPSHRVGTDGHGRERTPAVGGRAGVDAGSARAGVGAGRARARAGADGP